MTVFARLGRRFSASWRVVRRFCRHCVIPRLVGFHSQVLWAWVASGERLPARRLWVRGHGGGLLWREPATCCVTREASRKVVDDEPAKGRSDEERLP